MDAQGDCAEPSGLAWNVHVSPVPWPYNWLKSGRYLRPTGVHPTSYLQAAQWIKPQWTFSAGEMEGLGGLGLEQRKQPNQGWTDQNKSNSSFACDGAPGGLPLAARARAAGRTDWGGPGLLQQSKFGPELFWKQLKGPAVSGSNDAPAYPRTRQLPP